MDETMTDLMKICPVISDIQVGDTLTDAAHPGVTWQMQEDRTWKIISQEEVK